MTALRQRMLEDLRLRNVSASTQKAYIRYVAAFARHFKQSPDKLSAEQARQYLLHLIQERHVSFSTYNVCRSAISFFYQVTLGQRQFLAGLPRARDRRRLPVVLSCDELRRFFAVIRNPRHKAIFLTFYGAGLRASELLALRPQDIDSGRMLIHVREGKGRKERYAKLSPHLLEVLRDYYRRYRPSLWLFPGRSPEQRMTRGNLNHLAREIAQRAAISKRIGPHTFRHTYATHMLDAGADLPTIQALLGHQSIRTTSGYLHVSQKHINAAPSPLDLLYPAGNPGRS